MSCHQCGASSTASSIPPVPSMARCLFTSNICPVDSDAAAAKRFIAAAESFIGVLDCRIEILRAVLDQLVAERGHLSSRIAQHRVILSPVRRIPPELICEILAWIPPQSRKIGRHVVEQPPWQLAHICRSWRQAALACPSLWSSFSVLHHGYPVSFPPEMIETQLFHTGSQPLDIYFGWKHDGALQDTSCWDLFLPLCHRWRSLRIECPSNRAAEALIERLRVVQDNVPLLERVEFFLDDEDPVPLDGQWDLLSNAPRLSQLFLVDVALNSYSPDFTVPWSQITHYRGVFPHARQLDILRRSPNLVQCSIGSDDEDVTAVHPDMMVQSLHLRQLHAEHCSIIGHIIAPALQHLSVNNPSPTLHPFIHHSSCSLTTLVVTKGCTLEDLSVALPLCLALERLVVKMIRGFPSADTTLNNHISSFIDTLQISSTSSPSPGTEANMIICPVLAIFGLGFPIRSSQINFDWTDKLFRMIQSRSLSTVRLFNVGLPRKMDDVRLPQALGECIQRLRDEQSLDIEYLTAGEGVAFMGSLG
ncbi:hypothetical protein FB45DRAFT_798391 [Roridomyces roridus]|uniref:F-box domain-containing protein n=1 Tax=Roridomyces roridus TaxID=1738132 RepID=A0AAD7FG99_9AGAR|nr:hypothetical protein FB45DRAFT_798391 [Roridomyces roridus]